MRWQLITIIFLSLLWIQGCKTDPKSLAEFEVPVRIEIPAGLNTIETHIFEFYDFNANYFKVLESKGIDPNEVDIVETFQASMTPIFGFYDYGEFAEVTVDIFPGSQRTENIEIAYRFPQFNESPTTLQLIPGIADVREILQGNFGVKIRIRLREITRETLTHELLLRWRAR